jgi:hypothetical protein
MMRRRVFEAEREAFLEDLATAITELRTKKREKG